MSTEWPEVVKPKRGPVQLQSASEQRETWQTFLMIVLVITILTAIGAEVAMGASKQQGAANNIEQKERVHSAE